jgi:ABC-type sugar transport system permease subunit
MKKSLFSRISIRSSELSENQFAYLFILPLVAVLLALFVFPFLYSLWVSFHNVRYEIGVNEFVGLSQYIRALKDPVVQEAILRTLEYTAMVTIMSTLISVSIALLLNENFRGKRWLATIVILPWGISTYAAAIVWRYMYFENIGFFNAILKQLNLITEPFVFLNPERALISVALAHTWQLAPLGIYFILASLQVIPNDLYRAAKIDRLGVIGRFRFVTLPYIRNALLIILVLITMEAARIFDIIYFSTSGGPAGATTTLPYQIYLTTFQHFDIGYGSAQSYILLAFLFLAGFLYFCSLQAFSIYSCFSEQRRKTHEISTSTNIHLHISCFGANLDFSTYILAIKHDFYASS